MVLQFSSLSMIPMKKDESIYVKSKICGQCFLNMRHYGEMCLILLNEICLCFTKQEGCFYHDKDPRTREVVSFLESKDLVVTTEIGHQDMQVIPNMMTGVFDETDEVFCWCSKKR